MPNGCYIAQPVGLVHQDPRKSPSSKGCVPMLNFRYPDFFSGFYPESAAFRSLRELQKLTRKVAKNLTQNILVFFFQSHQEKPPPPYLILSVCSVPWTKPSSKICKLPHGVGTHLLGYFRGSLYTFVYSLLHVVTLLFIV